VKLKRTGLPSFAKDQAFVGPNFSSASWRRLRPELRPPPVSPVASAELRLESVPPSAQSSYSRPSRRAYPAWIVRLRLRRSNSALPAVRIRTDAPRLTPSRRPATPAPAGAKH
jgi:hypothetical protein